MIVTLSTPAADPQHLSHQCSRPKDPNWTIEPRITKDANHPHTPTECCLSPCCILQATTTMQGTTPFRWAQPRPPRATASNRLPTLPQTPPNNRTLRFVKYKKGMFDNYLLRYFSFYCKYSISTLCHSTHVALHWICCRYTLQLKNCTTRPHSHCLKMAFPQRRSFSRLLCRRLKIVLISVPSHYCFEAR